MQYASDIGNVRRRAANYAFQDLILNSIVVGLLVSCHSVTSKYMTPWLHQVIYTSVVAMYCPQREVIWTHPRFQLAPSEQIGGSFNLKYWLLGRARNLSIEQSAAETSLCQSGYSYKEIPQLTGISLRSVQRCTRVFWQWPDGDIQTTW